MAQVINTNVGALFAGAALNKSANALQTAQARLSSGLRINSVADDATGLQIASGYDAELRGTNVAIRNANDAISQAQTLDGYASQMNENLLRMYEVAVQVGDADAATNEEFVALVAENTRIAGLMGDVALIGKDITVDGKGSVFPAESAVVTDPSGVTDAATVLDAINTLSGERALFGKDIATFSSAVATMQLSSVNLSASYSRIMDTDYAKETAQLARNNILQQAGTSMLAQANQTPQSVLSLLR